MRTIKFRAWEKKLKEMITVSTVDFNKEMINTDSLWRYFYEVDLMQYAGLTDKNGKEIYEGDILSTDLSRPYLVVEFRNGAFMFQCHDTGEDYYDFMTSTGDNSYFTKHHEVIGNIYEDKELLGESDNNLYAYGDVFLKEASNDIEPDYVYINPTVYELKNDYLVVVNEDGSQLELLDTSSGIWLSKGITHDTELIRHIENILEVMI